MGEEAQRKFKNIASKELEQVRDWARFGSIFSHWGQQSAEESQALASTIRPENIPKEEELISKQGIKDLAMAAHASMGVSPKNKAVFDSLFGTCPSWLIRSLPRKLGGPSFQSIRAGLA